jgi:aminoglycoside phosphotransferase (APT) family kinase protein
MGREWKLISSLGPTSIPVPQAYGICTDHEVTGASFYVMEHVEGRPLFTIEDTLDVVPESKRGSVAFSLFDVLADIHLLDPDDIGLGDIGKKGGYVERQLKAWYGSWMASVIPANYDDPRAHTLHTYLQKNIPTQGSVSLLHGDYGFHNCLVGHDSNVVAVLDWEISSLGVPLADLAYALNRWSDPDDVVVVDPLSSTRAPGMPTRSELAQRYASRTGYSLDSLGYFRALSFWKSASIIHGVYSRYVNGQKSAEGVDLDLWRERIERCLTAAEDIIQKL